jgi:probable phosphoglycerate mutase
MIRVILVRHGQTEWNQVERFHGRADILLNEIGRRQTETTALRIATEWQPAAVYSSPLSRALETAEAIARQIKLPVEIHPGLIDIDYGDWEGLTPQGARKHWPNLIEVWYNAPHLTHIPGGETLYDLRTRGFRCVSELATHHQGQIIVLVGHTVINRVILLGIMGLGNNPFWKLRQDTCAINVFEADRDDFTIVSLNDTCHLRAESEAPSQPGPDGFRQ